MDEFVKEFLVECQEGLEQFESQLVELEKDPDAKGRLSSLFRIIHSMKGSSAFLGFPRLAELAHEGEDLLGRLRDGRLPVTPAIVSGLLAMSDGMRSRLSLIDSSRTEGEGDDHNLITRLRALQSGNEPAPAAKVVSPQPEPEIVAVVAAPIAAPVAVAPVAVVAAPVAVPEVHVEPEPVEPTPAPGPSAAETTIRVDVELLDSLMNLVGELVLTRNQILRGSFIRDETMLQAGSQRLNAITTELQEAMMKTRMQPIRNIWSKLPRVVRDLALECGKQARLVTQGEETELDKTVIEAIKDPITHVVRNAIDHGIEAPDVRVARGKPAEGTLKLRAYHEGGMVNVEFSDDGAGIDPARLRAKALERGWLNPEQAARWSDAELIGLIFRPGFSTAEALTMVSGRGVGMDVVKSRVESVGGSVEAQSRLGEGTTIKLKIPLTLTIVNALIVSSGEDRFAIPQANLVELIRLEGDAAGRSVHSIHGALVCRYRGRLLPLLVLNDVLEVGGPAFTPTAETVNIVVLQADQRQFGLVVDRIDDAQEIVVRPLARQLKGIACLAGATIMGDGRIALILDVFGLARNLHEAAVAPSEIELADGQPEAPAAAGEQLMLLLLQGTDGGHFALPLSHVDRMESVRSNQISWLGGQPYFAFRGTLLPLIDLSKRLAGRAWERPEAEALGASDDDAPAIQVVIPAEGSRRVGFVVANILDIVDATPASRGEPGRPGVEFTAEIQGIGVEVLDLPRLLETIDGSVSALGG